MRPLICRAALALALLTWTPGCLTASVWGGGVFEDDDGTSSIRFTGGTALSESPWINLLVTPLTLVFDICTSPVQMFLFGWDEEDDPHDFS